MKQSDHPLISIIVPTRNSAKFLQVCLDSIKAQKYPNIELLIVDNHSNDKTLDIAKEYTKDVYTHGPERSAQVNYGVTKAKGDWIYKVDSDFVLDPNVVTECVAKAQEGYDAIVVHNSPDVRVSWIAKIRKFEVDMYKYDLTHSSARFIRKDVYQAIDGFNEAITFGEDYDIQNRLNRAGYKTGFVQAEALHLGEPKKFLPHLKKYYDYGKNAVNYKRQNTEESKQQLAFFRSVYLKNWKTFVRHPIKSIEFITYSVFKYAAGGFGYFIGVLSQKKGQAIA
jgi:glycosyltransferase involved in cell wall biosynthesis